MITRAAEVIAGVLGLNYVPLLPALQGPCASSSDTTCCHLLNVILLPLSRRCNDKKMNFRARVRVEVDESERFGQSTRTNCATRMSAMRANTAS
jgi:hypothetical protein